MGRLSSCESARVQGFYVGVAIGAAAPLIALALPSGAMATGSSVLRAQGQRGQAEEQGQGQAEGRLERGRVARLRSTRERLAGRHAGAARR